VTLCPTLLSSPCETVPSRSCIGELGEVGLFSARHYPLKHDINKEILNCGEVADAAGNTIRATGYSHTAQQGARNEGAERIEQKG